MGFSDKRISEISGISIKKINEYKFKNHIKPLYKRVDTCAGEFNSATPYLYSSYNNNYSFKDACEANPTIRKKIIILGGGPNRIGQGIEFDYCCVHAVFALKEMGYETIMINCNPETVSTDYDTADRLYFEPLTAESVNNIINIEKQNGNLIGAIIQFGGQTPLNIAKEIEKHTNILGTSTNAVDLSEDREDFKENLLAIYFGNLKSSSFKLQLPFRICYKKDEEEYFNFPEQIATEYDCILKRARVMDEIVRYADLNRK